MGAWRILDGMRTEKLSFAGSTGHRLAGVLDLPLGRPRGYALFAHCFTCSKDLTAVRRISSGLIERGFAVLRFDFTGLGESEGDFGDSHFSANVADLVSAARYLGDTRERPTLLIGHSLGGAAVLAAAAELSEVTAVVTIGAPCEPGHVRKLFCSSEDEIAERGHADVELAGRTFRITKEFVEDLSRQKMQDSISRLSAALLVMHSPTDEVVGIDNARCIYDAARHPKSFVSLDGADHLLTRRPDSEFVAEVVSSWVSRYVGQPAQEETAEGEVMVRGTSAGLIQEVVAGTHHLVADEPTKLGGTDAGPTPYDLVLAGLGACTSMTLRLYARRKQWDLQDVEVRLTHGRIHARDCDDCDKESGFVDVIERTIEIHGELDSEQRERLMEIADKCPVHRTLVNEIRIRTTAVD